MTNTPSRRSGGLVSISLADWIALAALAALCLAFFWRMTFTDLILPRGDTFTYFYPYWAYRDFVLAAGKIPLWNPYLFMGAPFLANSQAGVLYPLNWPLIWFDAPTAVKVASVAHIVIAAWGAYALARRALRLHILPSVFAAALFALGGYLTSQVEHVNQLQGLAWLPWLLWLWDETLRNRSRIAPLGFAAVLAMQLLAGHSQSAFISLVGVAAWTAWQILGEWLALRNSDPAAARQPRRFLPLGWPVGILALAVVGAAALSAAQLLPTLELTRLSNRSGGLPFLEALTFSLRPTLFGRSLLPQYTQPEMFSEYVAYSGVAALILSIIGGWLGRKDWRILGFIALAGLSVFLALGAYNPLYWAIVKVVPGFGLFRAPARWLALWALASAVLAGVGLERVGEIAWKDRASMRLVAVAVGVIVVLAGWSFLAQTASTQVPGATAPSLRDIAAWLAVLAVTCGLIVWHSRASTPLSRHAPTLLAAFGLVELFVASHVEPFNHLSTPEAWSGQRPAISTILAADQNQVAPPRFLSLSDILFDPGDLHELEAAYQPYLSADQIYDFVIADKQKEILAPNLPLYWRIPAMDGFDGGILPTRDYTHFTSFFVSPDKQSPDGRLRENLKSVPDLSWLRLADVHWIITDKVFDAWLDGVYYDLQFEERRGPDPASLSSPIEGYPSEPFVSTGLGLLGHIEGSSLPSPGTPIGSLRIFAADGKTQLGEIGLVVDQAQPSGIGSPGVSATSVGSFTPGRPDRVEYRTLITWPDPRPVGKVALMPDPGFPAALVVKGMTLIDTRTGASSGLTLSQNHCLSLANSGDVKVYRYDCAPARAYLVCNPQIASTADEAWSIVGNIPASGATVVEDTTPPVTATCNPSIASPVTISRYDPERVELSAHVEGQGVVLVLSDAWYPGWEARVDGQPTPVLRADGLFRAIRITPGDHEVVFTYRSRPFEIGLIISLVSLVALIAALAFPSLRRKTDPPV